MGESAEEREKERERGEIVLFFQFTSCCLLTFACCILPHFFFLSSLLFITPHSSFSSINFLSSSFFFFLLLSSFLIFPLLSSFYPHLSSFFSLRDMVLTVLDRLIRGFASSAREELDAITYKLLASESKYKKNGKSLNHSSMLIRGGSPLLLLSRHFTLLISPSRLFHHLLLLLSLLSFLLFLFPFLIFSFLIVYSHRIFSSYILLTLSTTQHCQILFFIHVMYFSVLLVLAALRTDASFLQYRQSLYSGCSSIDGKAVIFSFTTTYAPPFPFLFLFIPLLFSPLFSIPLSFSFLFSLPLSSPYIPSPPLYTLPFPAIPCIYNNMNPSHRGTALLLWLHQSINQSINQQILLTLFIPEIVCSAIGESVPVQDTVKPGIPGAISAGLSAGSGCTGAVIGELEGWGSLWTLKAEGASYYTGTLPLICSCWRNK